MNAILEPECYITRETITNIGNSLAATNLGNKHANLHSLLLSLVSQHTLLLSIRPLNTIMS